MDDPLLWIALRNVPGLRRDIAVHLLQVLGSPREIFQRGYAELKDACGETLAAALRSGPDLTAASRELEAVRKRELAVLLYGRPGFPEALQLMPDPPLVLYARGSLPRGPALAIVGSRRPSGRARRAAQQYAEQLAADGTVIISGLAYGIDAAAHEGALRGAGRTVAIFASGLDRPGPVGNQRLAARILDSGGAWLSEYPPGQTYRTYHFPERNRLISGLARATLVVEAREKSGTLWTARHALEQGRNLGVIPGPTDSELCRGSNALLRTAVPILDVIDLRLLVGVWPPRKAAAQLDLPEVSSNGGVPEQVLAQLRDGPLAADDLVRKLGVPAASLAATLLELELLGRVAREGARVVLLR